MQARGEDLVDAAVLQVGLQRGRRGAACRRDCSLATWRRLVTHLVHAGARASAACRRAGSAARPRFSGRITLRYGLAVDLEAGHRAQDRAPSGRSRTPGPLLPAVGPRCRRTRCRPRGTSRRACARCCRRVPGRCRGAGSGRPRPAAWCPRVTPRDRCERNLTHSKNCRPGRFWKLLSRSMRWNSSQVGVLRLPHLGGQRAAHRAGVLARGLQASCRWWTGCVSSLTMNVHRPRRSVIGP